MLTDIQKEVLQFLGNIFNSNGIKFQVTGGLAAIAYGAQRPLYDIDIDIYKRDVEKIRALLREYIVEDWNNELVGEEDNFDLWMMTLEIQGVSIDISQLEGSRVRPTGGEWASLPETMNTISCSIEGVEVPVQNRQELVSYKKVIARDTDLEDVRQITLADLGEHS